MKTFELQGGIKQHTLFDTQPQSWHIVCQLSPQLQPYIHFALWLCCSHLLENVWSCTSLYCYHRKINKIWNLFQINNIGGVGHAHTRRSVLFQPTKLILVHIVISWKLLFFFLKITFKGQTCYRKLLFNVICLKSYSCEGRVKRGIIITLWYWSLCLRGLKLELIWLKLEGINLLKY